MYFVISKHVLPKHGIITNLLDLNRIPINIITNLYKICSQIQLDMDWFSCTTTAIETCSLIMEMIVKLSSETCPRILSLPNQDPSIFAPHPGSPAL